MYKKEEFENYNLLHLHQGQESQYWHSCAYKIVQSINLRSCSLQAVFLWRRLLLNRCSSIPPLSTLHEH